MILLLLISAEFCSQFEMRNVTSYFFVKIFSFLDRRPFDLFLLHVYRIVYVCNKNIDFSYSFSSSLI